MTNNLEIIERIEKLEKKNRNLRVILFAIIVSIFIVPYNVKRYSGDSASRIVWQSVKRNINNISVPESNTRTEFHNVPSPPRKFVTSGSSFSPIFEIRNRDYNVHASIIAAEIVVIVTFFFLFKTKKKKSPDL